ncbi:MAG: tyrosine-type recombinase/integrase [Sporolactobacillus sp.]
MKVEPIRSKAKIKAVYQYLYHKDAKYGTLFKLGVNTGLRISDLIDLRLSDIFNEQLAFREHLILKEKKTNKEKRIKLNDTVRDCLSAYIKSRPFDYQGYLFYSKKGGHIGRIQVYRVLREAGTALDVENIGTHSMRKTWGYWTYKMSRYNIGLIMDTLNHSAPAITLRYIGIDQDQKDDLYELVQL